ncbi:MAG TPA: histidine kinase, partial [Armatimonadota bacterium]|nr:histidine kinase [Armatimonadota bacterium]
MPEQPDDARVREEHERAAARLREQLPEVMRRWEGHVRAAEPLARDLDQETLHNNLPEVLAQIADVLVTSIGQDAYAYARIPASKEHAEQRAGLEGYTLDLVVLEYHLLRRAIVEVMEQGEPLSREVSSVIHDGIDRAMQEAAVHLVEEHGRAGAAHEEARRKLIQQLLTAQEDERRRISRELHDRSGQHLTALLLGLKALESHSAPPQQSATLELLEKLRAVASELSIELHDLSVQLRPIVLDDFGLCPALAGYLEEWGERAGIC